MQRYIRTTLTLKIERGLLLASIVWASGPWAWALADKTDGFAKELRGRKRRCHQTVSSQRGDLPATYLGKDCVCIRTDGVPIDCLPPNDDFFD